MVLLLPLLEATEQLVPRSDPEVRATKVVGLQGQTSDLLDFRVQSAHWIHHCPAISFGQEIEHLNRQLRLGVQRLEH